VGDVVAFLFAGADISEVEHMANVDVSQLKFDGAVSGSKMGFMVTAFKRAQKQSEPVAQSDPYQQESSSTLQSLETFFSGKLQKKLVELDMAQAMKEAGLADLFHDDLWPASTAVRELATQLKTKRFAYSDLKKFLPPSCETFIQVFDPAVDPEAAAAKQAKGGKALDLATWLMAWERFALAAAMVKMIDFSDAMRYKLVCCCVRLYCAGHW